ncbi:MAG: response regulator [Deltaproteobacteria bacterium]|nr:response regulator [Deltaproteobacteria bacterium]
MAQKVLIVEDDPNTRRMVEVVLKRDRMLRYQELEVFVASDGEEGLEIFERERPDVVVTDLLMPKVDGFKLIETLRAREDGEHLPILGISGVIREQRALRNLERDYNVQVQLKPFSPRIISERVKRLLMRAKELHDPGGSTERVPSKEIVLGSPSSQGQRKVDPRAPRRAEQPPASAVAASKKPEEIALAAGQIGDPAVARLLLQMFKRQLSGRLELERAKVRKVIYILSGHPIFVQSNIRSETLGQLLVRRGGISEEQHRQVLLLAQRDRVKYGEALARMGVMSESEVMEELKRQTLHKVQSCLGWRDGSWAIFEDPEVGSRVPQCTVAPVNAVFSALARSSDAGALAIELMALGANDVLVLSPGFRPYAVDFAGVHGPEILQRLSAQPQLSTLLYGEGAEQVAAAIDTLLVCGLATLQPASSTPALRAEATPAPRAEATPAPRAEATPAPRAEATPAPSEESDLEVLLQRAIGEPESDVDAIPEPYRPARISGQFEPVEPRSGEKDRIARALIESAYLGLHEQTHYEVLGVIPETDQDGIEVAYKIKRSQFDAERFREHYLGEAFGHLEEICAALDRAFSVLGDSRQRVAYDAQLGVEGDGEGNRALEAERLYQSGLALLERDQNAEAEAMFDRAAELDDQPDYRAQGAWAHFLARGAGPEVAVEAMVRLQVALEVEAHHTGVQLIAARISRRLGAVDEALVHLREALKSEPAHGAVFEEMESVLATEGRYEELEKEYRRVLDRLRGQNPRRSAELWKRLVLLYRDRLGDLKRARKACDAAFRLAPHDEELGKVLLDLDARSPAEWPKAVLGYRALLRNDPGASAPILDLFHLHRKDHREDAALIVAQAAALRGVDDEEMRSCWARYENQALRRPKHGLDAEGWRDLRHPDEDLLLTGIFALLTPLIDQIHPLRPSDLDLEPFTGDHLALTAEMTGLIHYTCRQLALSEAPAVKIKPELGSDVRGAGTTPPVLLIGEDLLLQKDSREVLFRLMRAVALLRPGYKVTGWRDPALLEKYLVAVVGLFYPEFVGEDELVREIQSRVAGDETLLAGCRRAVQRIHDRGEEIDFARWQRGVLRTAERVALLLCGDLRVAGIVVAEGSPEAGTDLVDFALSAAYARLRTKTGLAVKD